MVMTPAAAAPALVAVHAPAPALAPDPRLPGGDEAGASLRPADLPHTPLTVYSDGALLPTVAGRMTSSFGWRRDPINGAWRRHQGIDFAGVAGSPVRAAAAGTVIVAARRGDFGNLVEIRHDDGRDTLYGHLDRILIAPGERVRDGEIVGTLGSTGRSTGPHLHFEVRVSGRSADPLSQPKPDAVPLIAPTISVAPRNEWAGKPDRLPVPAIR